MKITKNTALNIFTVFVNNKTKGEVYLGYSEKPDDVFGVRPINGEWVKETEHNHTDNIKELLKDWMQHKKSNEDESEYTKNYILSLINKEQKGELTRKTCNVVIDKLNNELKKISLFDGIQEYGSQLDIVALADRISIQNNLDLPEKDLKFTKKILKEALLDAVKSPLIGMSLEKLILDSKFTIQLISKDMEAPGSYHPEENCIKINALQQVEHYKYESYKEMYSEICKHEIIHAAIARVNTLKQQYPSKESSTLFNDETFLSVISNGIYNFFTENLRATLPLNPMLPNIEYYNRARKIGKYLRTGEKRIMELENNPKLVSAIHTLYTPKIFPGSDGPTFSGDYTNIKTEKVTIFKNDFNLMMLRANSSGNRISERIMGREAKENWINMEKLTEILSGFPLQILKETYPELVEMMVKEGYFFSRSEKIEYVQVPKF